MDYGIDTSNVELESLGLPEGGYRAMISSEEIKPTKDGLNKLLEVTFNVVEGAHKNKTIISRFNLWHSNEVAKNMAQQDLKKIALATGKEVNGEQPLKGRALTIFVRKQKNNPDYSEVWKYAPIDKELETSNEAPF